MITNYLHQNPRILVLLLTVIVLAGVSSYLIMPRLEDPALGQRVAVVSTIFPGADPARMESTVTIPVEECIDAFAEIKNVRSNTRANISNVVVELKDEVSKTDAVWSAIENKLATLTDQLPNGCEPAELTVFPLKAHAAILAITPTKRQDAEQQEMEFLKLRKIARTLRESILAIPATESVEIFGDPGTEVVVEVDPAFLANSSTSTGQIAEQLSANQSGSAGIVRSNGNRMLLDVAQDTNPITQLADSFVEYLPTEEPVMLREIAEVKERLVMPRPTKAIVNGQDSIVLGVMVNPNARVDLWASDLEQVVDDFQSSTPAGYSVDHLFSQSGHINARMEQLLANLGLATLAVVIAVFLMMGWRCMIVVAVSLPLSAMLVLFGMRMMSIPIHQMSITGLTVALGLLIDNAIVMVEEVRSRVFAGKSPAAAIVASVRHLGLPLLGSTITTVLAFLPIATLPGPSGEFVGSIAISVILAVSASFVLSMTIIPPLVNLLGVNAERQSFFEYGFRSGWIESAYRFALKTVFRAPALGVVLGVVLPAIGFYYFRELPRQFFPATDRSQVQIEVELPAASQLVAVEKCVDQIRVVVEQESGVLRQSWFLGHSAPTFYYNVVPRRRGVPSYAQAIVDTDNAGSTAELVDRLQRQIDEQVLNARVVVRQLEQGPPFDAPVEIRLLGPELETLQLLGTELRQVLATSGYVNHTRSDLEDTTFKLDLVPDPSSMKDLRLDNSSLSRFLYSCSEGAPAGTLFQHDEELPVKVTVGFGDRAKHEVLSALPFPIQPVQPIRNASFSSAEPTGQPNPPNAGAAASSAPAMPTLGSIGQFELSSDVAAIIRLNGERVNEVKAYIQPDILPAVVLDEFKQRLGASEFVLPDGYGLQIGGESEQRSEAVRKLMANAVVLFSIMMLTLVAVLGSFRRAFIIALVGGMAVGLGPLALYLFGLPFGFMAIVGTMGLVGVAINDSIVVLAAIDANRKLPTDEQQELADVVIGCTRHILATTFTTIVGFLPLVIDGGQFWPPLAIVIAAGVGGATLLALFFTPALSKILEPGTEPTPPATE